MSTIETYQFQVMDAPAHRVYGRLRWQDNWTLLTHVYCAEFEFALSPGVGRAVLVWIYGQVARPGESSLSEVSPRTDLDRAYVQIEVDQVDEFGDPADPIRWYGRVQEVIDQRHGTVTADMGGDSYSSRTGVQRFLALGLEHELDQVPVEMSICDSSAGEITIGRAIGFNRGNGDAYTDGLRAQPNKAAAPGASGTAVFAADLTAAELWNGREIIEYLLLHHAPRDVGFQRLLPFTLDTTDGQVDWLEWTTPALDVHGLSIKQIVDQICDRRRLMSWRVVVAEGGDPQIQVRAFAHETIELWDGTVLSANPDQRTFNFEAAFNVVSARLVRSRLHGVDVVHGTGARRTATFTGVCAIDEAGASPNDEFVRDYDQTLIDDYNAGASNLGSVYDDADRETKQRLNYNVRSEERFGRVYSFFRMPDDWNGITSNAYVVHPQLTDNGELPPDPQQQPEPFWQPGMRFLNTLPLKLDHDYSGDKIATGTVVDATPAGARPEYRRLLFVVQFGSGDTERLVAGDRVADEYRSESEDDGGRSWSCSVRARDECPGFVVHVQGGAPHKIDPYKFVALDVDDQDLADDSVYSLIATVCWETDSFCRTQYPPPSQVTVDEDALRTLRIDFGDDYRLDYVTPQTLVDLRDNEPQFSDGGFVRDDRPQMYNVCKIAHSWYSKPRHALALVYRGILRACEVGDLITQIGQSPDTEEVNCVVTAISYDLESQTTTIETDFAEFEPRAFL